MFRIVHFLSTTMAHELFSFLMIGAMVNVVSKDSNRAIFPECCLCAPFLTHSVTCFAVPVHFIMEL